MDEIFKSNAFLIVTIVLDVLLLSVINSNLLPIRATAPVAAFVLLALSPVMAYITVRFLRTDGQETPTQG